MSGEVKMRNPKKYKMRYRLVPECGEFTRDQIDTKLYGACDAFLFISIVDEGDYSIRPVTLDGRTKRPLSPTDTFKAWVVLARGLADCEELSPGRRCIAGQAFQTFQSLVLESRKEENSV